MNKKRMILLVCTLCLTALLVAAAPLAAGSAKGDQGPCRLQGAWIMGIEGPLPWTDTLVMQESFVPLDPNGKRLLYRILYINADDTFAGAYPEVDYLSEAIGEMVRTGTDTYDYTAISYGAKLIAEPLARDEIQYIYVQTGTLQCIDNDTHTVVAYGAVYDNSQDADGDGFPDEGQEPIFTIGPLTDITGQRMPMLPPSAP